MRLVTFGCSFTQGIALEPHMTPDVIDQWSDYAWPALLGKLIGCEVVNRGLGGSCNKQILYSFLNFPLQKDDVVIIMWSIGSRYSVITKEHEDPVKSVGSPDWICMRPFYDESREYYQHLNHDFDNNFVTSVYMDYVHLFCKNRGVKCIHLSADSQYLRDLKKDDHYFARWMSVKPKPGFYLDDDFFLEKGYDREQLHALDGSHPGIPIHEELAQRIFDKYFKDATIA